MMGLTTKDFNPDPDPEPVVTERPMPEWPRLVVEGAGPGLNVRLVAASLLEPGVYRLVKET